MQLRFDLFWSDHVRCTAGKELDSVCLWPLTEPLFEPVSFEFVYIEFKRKYVIDLSIEGYTKYLMWLCEVIGMPPKNVGVEYDFEKQVLRFVLWCHEDFNVNFYLGFLIMARHPIEFGWDLTVPMTIDRFNELTLSNYLTNHLVFGRNNKLSVQTKDKLDLNKRPYPSEGYDDNDVNIKQFFKGDT